MLMRNIPLTVLPFCTCGVTNVQKQDDSCTCCQNNDVEEEMHGAVFCTIGKQESSYE